MKLIPLSAESLDLYKYEMKTITEHEPMICQDCQKTISAQNDIGYWGIWDTHSEGAFCDENSYKMHLCIRCYYTRVDKEEKHDR